MSRQASTAQAAASVIVVDGNRVLLTRRAKAPFENHWAFPGGSRKAGESAKDNALRELHEETGLTAVELVPLTEVERRTPDTGNGPVFHFRISVFLCTSWTGVPHSADDSAELRWVTREQAAHLPLVPGIDGLIGEMLLDQ